MVELIASWFKAEDKTRLVDPCCGKGEALAQFASLVDPEAETWGVEICYSRALQAKDLLNTVLSTSFYDLRTPARWSNASVSLAFNNPPYDWSSFEEIRNGQKRKLRHEVLFIEGVTPKIVPGGHQVIIVPRGILGDKSLLGEGQEGRVARHLLGWYESVTVLRFPDGEYERFKQVVVLACQKRGKYAPPTKEAIEAITAWPMKRAKSPSSVKVSMRLPSRLSLPGRRPSSSHLWILASWCSSGSSAAPSAHLPTSTPPTCVPSGLPSPRPCPFIGHISMLIAGQETGVLSLPSECGTILVKGMTRKVVDVSTSDSTNDKGQYTHTNVTEREKHVATITIAHQDGDLEMLQSTQEVGDFVTQYADPIAEAILQRNQPLYDLLPAQDEWEGTQNAAKGLPPLPGREKRGLFDVQRHFAIATARVMKARTHCILNAEMGFGKTSTAIASLDLMDQWPVLVMCPGHMVFKWQRDIQCSCNPEDPILARIITRPVLDKPPAWLTSIRPAIQAAGGVILETSRRQVSPVTPNDPGGRRKVVIGYELGNLEAIQKVVQKLAFKDSEAKKTLPPEIQFTKQGMLVEYVDRDEYTLFDFHADYTSGRLGRKAVAVVAFDPAKYDAGSEEKPAVRYVTRRMYNEQLGKYEGRKVPTCPTCGEVVDVRERFCQACHAPLFNFTRWRRVGLARLVQRKFRHFFKVYIGDEIHKCQNGRSDIGAADQRFLSSIKYSLALTGTLFGGTAGSSSTCSTGRVPELRQLYEFTEKNRFIDHYGVWEREWAQAKPYYEGETGASTGIKRWNYRQRELPGVAPAVIRFLLPITLFGNITDLGYELPPLYENVEELPMSEGLAEQYQALEKGLLSQALEIVRNGDIGVLSAWFAACRFRPASAFRPESVDYVSKKGRGEIHWSLPQVISSHEPWLPKEHKLAEIVRTNMAQGRKTLTFVEQTGTRDIRDR